MLSSYPRTGAVVKLQQHQRAEERKRIQIKNTRGISLGQTSVAALFCDFSDSALLCSLCDLSLCLSKQRGDNIRRTAIARVHVKLAVQ